MIGQLRTPSGLDCHWCDMDGSAMTLVCCHRPEEEQACVFDSQLLQRSLCEQLDKLLPRQAAAARANVRWPSCVLPIRPHPARLLVLAAG